MNRFLNQINYPNSWLVNPIGQSGGLFSLEILGSHLNMINCKFKIDARADAVMVTFMCGALRNGNGDEQWDYVSQPSLDYNHAWMLVGDLNFILSQSEKGGNSVSQSYLHNLRILLILFVFIVYLLKKSIYLV